MPKWKLNQKQASLGSRTICFQGGSTLELDNLKLIECGSFCNVVWGPKKNYTPSNRCSLWGAILVWWRVSWLRTINSVLNVLMQTVSKFQLESKCVVSKKGSSFSSGAIFRWTMRRLPSSIAQEFQFCQGSVLRISWGIKLHHTGDARNELVEILCTYIYIYVCVCYITL